MIKALYYIGCVAVLFTVMSCSLFEKDEEGTVLARVNDHTLTQTDVDEALGENFGSDSVTVVTSYINKWATIKLLMDGALRNLSASEQEEFEALVQGYRNDLYTKHYKDALVLQQLDSLVSDEEASAFYDENRSNFLLNERLLQFRFIQVDPEYSDLKTLKKIFIRFNEEDRYQLDSLRFQFKNHFLNDSVWIKDAAIVRQINVITNSNAERYLKKTNYLQLRDSLGLYLIAIKNRLDRNNIAPLEYVRPTIDQIIRNRRKVELVKKLEKEIKDDAIKNKKFEIYN